jgi:hypothetical protein
MYDEYLTTTVLCTCTCELVEAAEAGMIHKSQSPHPHQPQSTMSNTSGRGWLLYILYIVYLILQLVLICDLWWCRVLSLWYDRGGLTDLSLESLVTLYFTLCMVFRADSSGAPSSRPCTVQTRRDHQKPKPHSSNPFLLVQFIPIPINPRRPFSPKQSPSVQSAL